MADQQTLQTIIATYSAALQAIQFWRAARDRKSLASFAQSSLSVAGQNPIIIEQAKTLSPLVPRDVGETINRRFNGCWTRYVQVILPDSGASDEEIDTAEAELIRCACREAKRLFDISAGNLPPGPLRDFWEAHRCSRFSD